MDKYIYVLEYTGYKLDGYDSPSFRPVFISLDEHEVNKLFNKYLEENKNKPDFIQNNEENFEYTDGYKWQYHYSKVKYELNKILW